MTVLCIICHSRVTLTEATAGSLYANGQQAFACNRHIFERGAKWTLAWIAFDTEQRLLRIASVRTP